MTPHPPLAPCGCGWRSRSILRDYASLWPTVFVRCRCAPCNKTWTERYEFDFTVPLDGTPWEDQQDRKATP